MQNNSNILDLICFLCVITLIYIFSCGKRCVSNHSLASYESKKVKVARTASLNESKNMAANHNKYLFDAFLCIYILKNRKDKLVYVMNSIDYGIIFMFYKISYQIYAFINFKTEFDLNHVDGVLRHRKTRWRFP